METLALLQLSFDALLGLTLLLLAWRALSCPDLFRSIVFFIAFGLLMALAWVRLQAPDVALAEAAIGAGLTGALLLTALRRLRQLENGPSARHSPPSNMAAQPVVAIVAVLLLTTGLGYAILSLPSIAPGLSDEVSASLAMSGVGNPVTAVLLNFRGYDTLLELVVLLLALLAVWSLGEAPSQPESSPGPVLDSLGLTLTPLFILMAAYLLWVGADAPGGAFQAGSVLAAVAVLLLLSGRQLPAALSGLALRVLLVAGPVVFLAIAGFSLWMEGSLLKFAPTQAGGLILLLEIFATLSIGATLAALFIGGRPTHSGTHNPTPEHTDADGQEKHQ